MIFVADIDGNVHKKNTLTARTTLETLLGDVDEELFNNVVTDFRLMGRFEIRQVAGKTVVFDIAHTTSSIANLIENLKERFGDEKFVFLASIMRDKDAEKILKMIAGVADKIILTSSHDERGYSGDELGEFVDGIVEENPKKAFEMLLKNEGILVVTGSHFLVGKAYSYP